MPPHLLDKLSVPALAVDLAADVARALYHVPGMPGREPYRFLVPSPEFLLADQIRGCTALRRPLFLHGSHGGRSVVAAVRAHMDAGLAAYAHPAFAEALGRRAGNALEPGMRVAHAAPAGAQSIRAVEFDLEYWRRLMAMTGLPVPELTLAAASETGCPLEPDGAAGAARLLDALFARNAHGGIPLASLCSQENDPSMLRLCSIQRITGFSALERCVAFVFGVLAAPLAARRSRREGVTLLYAGGRHVWAALVYRDRLFALLGLPFDSAAVERDAETLEHRLGELRLGWLPVEEARNAGGFLCRAAALPPEAEGFRPTYVTGPNAARFARHGLLASSARDGAMNNCWGLLNAHVWRAGGNEQAQPC